MFSRYRGPGADVDNVPEDLPTRFDSSSDEDGLPVVRESRDEREAARSAIGDVVPTVYTGSRARQPAPTPNVAPRREVIEMMGNAADLDSPDYLRNIAPESRQEFADSQEVRAVLAAVLPAHLAAVRGHPICAPGEAAWTRAMADAGAKYVSSEPAGSLMLNRYTIPGDRETDPGYRVIVVLNPTTWSLHRFWFSA